jgi:hypothetical protein
MASIERAYAQACASVLLLFGEEEGQELVEHTLKLGRLTKVTTADELFVFASILEEGQGALSTVGRAAKAVAIMAGCRR